MSKESIRINAFRIKENSIPNKVLIYKISHYFEEPEDLYRFISHHGVKYGDNQLLTLEEPIDKEKLKLIGEKSLNQLEPHYQERLVSVWIRRISAKKKLDRKLRNNIENSLKDRGKTLGKISDRLEIYIDNRDIKSRVIYHDGKFYLTIDFSFSVSPLMDLWSYVNRNVEELNRLAQSSVRRWLKFILNPTGKKHPINRAKIILDGEKLLETLKYIEEKYPSEYVSWLKENKLDETQPVLMVNVGNGNIFPFVPQLCKLIFNLEDISEEERKELMNIWTFNNRERMEIIVEAVRNTFGEREFLTLEFNKLEPPSLSIRTKDKYTSIKNTAKIFSWIRNTKNPVYLPYHIPEILKGKEIKTYIFIDASIRTKVKDDATSLFRNYNKIRNYDEELPRFDYRGRTKFFSYNEIDSLLDDIGKEELGFALIVGSQKYKTDDHYDDMKRRLFEKNIISQNVIYTHLKNPMVINNLLLQIMSKLGIKYFALDEKLPYDYIMGIDVGNDKFGKRSIGGCSVIFDNNGKIEKIIPIEARTGGEIIDLKKVLEKIQDGEYLNFKGKRVLILRDGRASLSEIDELAPLSERWKSDFTLMNIIKSSIIRMDTDRHGYGGILNGHTGLLLAHSTKSKGARPIVIENKWIIEKGNLHRDRLTDDDIETIWKLTKLNYSVLFSDGFNLRLPAPVHYADKFVKALGRDWRIREELLKEGFLYFI